MSRTDVVVNLTDSILSMAKAAGADCIAVACPMCQINLDLRQQNIERTLSKKYDMPIIYVTQLLGLCLGVDASKLGFDKQMVSADKIVNKINACKVS
jgi:heterodisulfide reductase subunit B